jgi:pyrroline-5-carboxylate reductase
MDNEANGKRIIGRNASQTRCTSAVGAQKKEQSIMLSNTKISIIGGGNLGGAIAEGLLDSKQIQADQLFVTRRKVEKLESFRLRGVHTSNDNAAATSFADIIILAVKPYNMENVVNEIHPYMQPDQILVSLATAVTISDIHLWSSPETKIFRAMPNTATAVREAITCIASENGNDTEIKQIQALFSSIGESVVISEHLMEGATVLGACGIAYVLRFIRAMIQGGIEIGFDSQTATLIASHTVAGAARLLIENEQHPEAEIDKVTTPRGCTIAGLNEMEHQGFSSSLIKGIITSYEKIGEM